MRAIFALLLSVFLSACASSRSGKYVWDDTDEGSRAPAAAYAADGMYFRKEVPDRRDHKPWEFYYKHCSMAGDRGYISKTSYDCNGPYY